MQGVSQPRFRPGHMLAVFGLFLALFSSILQATDVPNSIAFGTSQIASLSNQYRIDAGLPALITSAQLTSSAQAKADHMANNGYFAHNAPDGTSPWYFIDSSGYSYVTAGENLALTNQDASSVVDGWFNSAGHRANMLSTTFTEVGYGIAYAPTFVYQGSSYDSIYLVAAHYALPNSPNPESPVTPQPSEPSQPATNQTPAEPVPQPEVQPTTPEVPVPQAEEQIVTENRVENNTESGPLASVESRPFRLTKLQTYSGIGGGGAFLAIGSGIEIRRIIHHQSLIPRFGKKKA